MDVPVDDRDALAAELGLGVAGGFQMQLEMLGGSFDYRKLDELAQQIVKEAQSEPSVRNLITTFRVNAPHVVMTVDRARAETLRVSVGDIFSTLTDYVGSTYVNQFNKFGLSLQVYVQADSKYRVQPDDLLKLFVRSRDGNMVPLSAVAPLLSPAIAPLTPAGGPDQTPLPLPTESTNADPPSPSRQYAVGAAAATASA